MPYRNGLNSAGASSARSGVASFTEVESGKTDRRQSYKITTGVLAGDDLRCVEPRQSSDELPASSLDHPAAVVGAIIHSVRP
jgi:hypothetical protein